MKLKYLFLFLFLFSARIAFLKLPDYPSDRRVKLVGRVTREPYLNASKQIIAVDRIKIVTESFPAISYGDKIEAVGKLEKRLIKNGRHEFVLYYPKILLLDHGEKASIWIRFRRRLITFRHQLEAGFSVVLPEPQASLLSGILLGAQKTISSEFFQNLRATGTIHIIAASGFNITVVAGLLISIFVLVLPRKIALFFAFGGIICYTLIAGAGPAVVRAAIMGSPTYMASYLGREKDAVTALVFSGLLMLFINPLIYSDIGFQLSFMATAGILFLLPLLENFAFFRTNFFGKEIGLTLVAQIAVLPIILYHFGSIGIFSLLVNGLVGPLVPYIMEFGAILIIPSLFFADLAGIFAIPAWVLLTVMVKLVNFFGAIPWANLEIRTFPFLGVVVYYSLITIIVVLIRRR